MSKTKIIALVALITALLVVSVTQAWAATMKFRIVTFHTKLEVIKVGDVEGHIIGVLDSPGLASFDTGEVAVLSQWGSFDYTKGAGIHKAYLRLTFEDGSTIDYKMEGTTRPDPKGEGSLLEGTSEIYQGSGRYARIQGKGTHTGKRVVALGAGAQVYFDFILTYTLP